MKLSELMELALTDLEKCESDSQYEIYMGQWHTPFFGKCQVCFAGAVMAQTCEANIDDVLAPYDFDDEWKARFIALDYVRSGLVGAALSRLGQDFHTGGMNVRLYHNDPDGFKTDMRRIVTQLKENGL